MATLQARLDLEPADAVCGGRSPLLRGQGRSARLGGSLYWDLYNLMQRDAKSLNKLREGTLLYGEEWQ